MTLKKCKLYCEKLFASFHTRPVNDASHVSIVSKNCETFRANKSAISLCLLMNT